MKGVICFLFALAALAAPAMANHSFIGSQSLLYANESVLLLIDHQPFQFADLHSHEPTMVQNNVIGLANTAKLFGIPTILTTVLANRGGALIPGIQAVFPNQVPIDRTWINAWEDPRVVTAIQQTGKHTLIIAALWTEICLAMPVISALGDGYEVFFVTDASGGKTLEAHDMAVLRMVQAGAVPVTFFTVLAELQRDWARPTTMGVSNIVKLFGGGAGIAYNWEVQLLSGSTNTNTTPSTATASGSSAGMGMLSSSTGPARS